MTLAEYKDRLKLAFAWQWRRSVFGAFLFQHWDNLTAGLWGLLAGLLSVVLVVVWPILVLFGLVYEFGFLPFWTPFKLNKKQTEQMREAVKQGKTEDHEQQKGHPHSEDGR